MVGMVGMVLQYGKEANPTHHFTGAGVKGTP